MKTIRTTGRHPVTVETLEGRRLLAVNVTVDGGVRHQTMDGFGHSLRVFDDPHVFENFNPATGRAATVLTTAQQNEVMDRLYRDLGLTRVRPVQADTATGSGIEPTNDNSDPNATDPTKFNFEWKRLDAHVDYLARARDRGVDTSFLSPLNRESWMGTSTAPGSTDAAEYGEWLMAQVRRAAARGVRLPYLSVANEPSYGRNSMSGEFIRDVIKNVGPRLRAEGFVDTMFVTTDDVRSSNAAAKARVVLADPAVRPYVGALATHLYDESVSNVGQMEALAEQYDLPLWMTEFSLSGMPSAGRPADAFAWASLMHELISDYDVSAVDYMWGFFGEWEGNSSMLATLNHTGATYDGYTLNKAYYTTGQFSRFVEPGAERIGAASSDADVQTTAFLNGDGGLVVVAINAGTSNEQVTFDLDGLPGFATFNAVRTSGSENWAALPPVTAGGSTFTAVLPHNSVTTFTAAAAPAAATVVGRRVFYNNSAYDGNDPAATAADDGAIAPDKAALLPGQAATFANYTSYSKGINGVMIDVRNLPAARLQKDDFVFRVGNAADVSLWTAAPDPTDIAVRPVAGGGHRVTLTWADGAVRNGWLQVAVLANTDTGLAAADVFYVGNAVGETFNSAAQFRVDGQDVARTRNAQLKPTDLASRYDHNRDRRVNTLDQAIARSNQRFTLYPMTAAGTDAGTAGVPSAGAPPASAGVVPASTTPARQAVPPTRGGRVRTGRPALDLLSGSTVLDRQPGPPVPADQRHNALRAGWGVNRSRGY